MTQHKPLTQAEIRAVVKDPNILREALVLNRLRATKPRTTRGLTSKWVVYHTVRWEKGFWPNWEIENGWVPLVDKLIEDILKLGWDGTISQCKQKFGGLRFYISGSGPNGDKVLDRIGESERESFKVCEKCGGRSTTKVTKSDSGGYKVTNQAEVSGWVMALCSKCWKKELAEKAGESQ